MAWRVDSVALLRANPFPPFLLLHRCTGGDSSWLWFCQHTKELESLFTVAFTVTVHCLHGLPREHEAHAASVRRMRTCISKYRKIVGITWPLKHLFRMANDYWCDREVTLCVVRETRVSVRGTRRMRNATTG